MASLDEARPARAPPLSLWDRFLVWRDRLVADPRFRARAAAWPIGRGIARRRASALFDLSAGFLYSRILLACLRLGLFEILRHGPLRATEVARRTGLSEERAERLLRAAAALDLAERRGGRFGLGPLGAACLDNPALAAMMQHHAAIAADFDDPVALLRGENAPTRLSRLWTYAGGDEDAAAVAAYSELMAASQPLVTEQILAAWPFRGHRLCLDLGGGSGTFACALARRWPHLNVRLVDLPDVAARAAARFDAEGLSPRVAAVAGDIRRDTLPSGADAATFVRVLHDHDDPAVLAMLRRAHEALGPGGKVIIAEPLADAPGARRVGDAYFGFYLLAMGQGRPRTAGEITALLTRAGFSHARSVKTRLPLAAAIVVGDRV